MRTSNWIWLITFGILVLLVQILILNNLYLNKYMFPQLYVVLLLTLPINIKHWVSYLVAFVIGFIVDSFAYTPGLHSFTCVMIMFLRYTYFNNFVDKEWLSTGITPNFDTTEGLWLATYVSIFSFIFTFILILLENFTFHQFGITLLKILYSSSLSILLILLFLFSFRKKTNDEV